MLFETVQSVCHGLLLHKEAAQQLGLQFPLWWQAARVLCICEGVCGVPQTEPEAAAAATCGAAAVDDDAPEMLFNELALTVLQQSTLCPLPQAVQPVHWAHEQVGVAD